MCLLAYLAAMHMKSQFPQAWLTHGSREISQITGGSDSLRQINFENCEGEPYTNCKFFDDHCIWLKDCRSADMKL